MIFVHDNGPTEKKILRDEDLQDLAHDLECFVKTYYEDLYITDDKDDDAFIKLKELQNIAQMLRQKRYDELFDKDISVEFDPHMYMSVPF